MDPASDTLAISASAPFPTIPAASSHRPRGGRPRRHAAPFRSDHLAAAGASSIRRSGIDLSRRPAASAFAQQEGSPSVSSWGASRDTNFVFGSGVAGAPEMTRSFSSGSGEASLTELLGEVDKLASDDGSGRRSDADAPDSLHYQTEKLEGNGAPSQTIQSDSAETRSLASQICTNQSVPIVFARSGGSLAIPNSVDEGSLPEDGSNISAHGGNVQQNVFVFGGHAGYRDSTANATQTSISKVDSADKDGVTYNSEQLNASIAKDSTCTKFVLQDAKHAFASTNKNPLHSEPCEVSPTVKFGSSFGSEEGDVNAKVSFIKVPYDIEAVAAPKLTESGLFNEKSYTVQDRNVASRNKGGVKGMIPNRRAVIPTKFSSAHQVSSLESVSRRNDHCSGKVSPEQKLKEASSFAFLDSGINCAQGNSYNSASQITESSHDGTEFTSAANTEHSGQSDFIFSASTFDQSTLHSQRRQNKKKSGGMFNPANSIQSLPSSAIGISRSEVSASQQCADSAAQWTEYKKMEPNRVTTSGGAECTKTENFEHNDNCETWRLRCPHDLLLSPPFAHLVSMDFHKGETTQPKSCKWCQNTLQNHLEVTGLPAHRVPGHQAEFRPKLRGHIGLLTDQKLVNQGNQAYAEGQLSKAEECYTHGIDSFSPNEASKKALMLCYSNRAATRMSLGKMREALSDCREATGIDSSFVKAQVRAANCLLALGDVEEAQKAFEICLKSSHRSSLDHKIVEEASDGLQKAQKISDFIHQSKEYLIKKAFDKMPSALKMISDALSTSIYSDDLMAMKAEALFLLQRYEEVIRFCEETLYIAERNSLCLCPDKRSESNNLNSNTRSVKLWRYHLIAKSYFFLGKLEEAHQFLKKYGQIEVTECRCGKQSQESISSLSMAISELLRLKAAGNEAFQSGKYLEAVEHYTAALLSNSESLRFLAICFCNRAAAYQAMGQILDAIADCSLAIALDADYAKAISRRSSLYEFIRDYDQAENDLRRLITLLEKHLQENMSMPSEKTESTRSNLNRANLRFSSLERDARKGASLNVYLILGIEPSSSAVDIKKAYRKAALRHHPDKAGKFLVRSENISDAIWREITNKIRRDADYLFKIIGKAYSMLSDPTMRRE